MRPVLLLALLSLTASADDRSGRFSRFCDRTATGRSDRGWLCDGLAFFEAFPASGAGVASVLAQPLPNWAISSDEFDNNANWTKTTSGAGSLPVVTANFSGTAERVQFSATGVGDRSYLVQLINNWAHDLSTCSFYVQGNGTSGTTDVCQWNGVGWTCADCVFTAAAATRCEIPRSAGVGTQRYCVIGNATGLVSGATRAAADVLVSGGMLNVGSTASGYVATTTVPKGYTVTGARGEPLVFARTGVAMASKKGLATTGLEAGDLILMPSGQPRVEPDSDSVLALRVESARTNAVVRSSEFDNAAFTRFATGVATPTITANQATAPDRTLTGDRIQIPAVTTAQTSIIFQSPVMTNAVTNTASIYIKGNGTSGTTDICVQGAGYICAACAYVSTSWTRCTVSGVAGGALQWTFGNMGAINVPATARDAVDAFIWQGQAEVGSYATSPIPSGVSSAIRNVETAYFSQSWASIASEGSVAVTMDRPKLFDTNGINFNTVPNGVGTLAPYMANSTSTGVFAGGIIAGQTVPSWLTNINRVAASWVGTTYSSHYAGNTVSGTGTAFNASNSVAQLCDYNTSHACDGLISRVCVDPSSSRCR